MTSATGTFSASAREAGFTLVELVVAIAIIGIASAAILLAMPGPAEAVQREAARVAARAVAARDLAILTGHGVELVTAPAGWMLQTTPPLPAAAAAPGLARLQLADGIRLDCDPAGPIRFDATGLATPAQLTLSGPGGHRARVTIDAAGQIHASPA
jgi:general secretion pathway protein H